MALDYLQGIPTQEPYTEETVDKVKDLLNSGQVDVNEVSTYFSVPKALVVQSLTDIPPSAYNSGALTEPQIDAVEKLIRTGVMSTPEVSEYFSATPEVVERHLRDVRGYNPSQIAEAQMGLPVTPYKEPEIDIVEEWNVPDTQTPVTQTPVTQTPATPTSQLPSVATTQYATGSEIPTGLRGAEMALKGGATGAIEMLDQLNRAGRSDLETQYGLGLEQAKAAADTATGYMQPYESAGQTALQQQLALSGALGQDAFNQAYQESPQMAFLREQGMRANLAGAAATGGLGGGNVQKELQRFGQGLASQGLQQQIANLGALSGQGYGAAGTMANIATGLGSQQLQAQTGLGQQLAGYNLSTGLPAAQTISGLGTNLAAGRTRAGEMLASQYGQTAQQLGGIYSGQGRDIAAMTDAQRQMIMNAVNSGAMTEAQAQQAYATNMANLQSSIGSQLAGVPNAPIYSPDYAQQAGQAFQAAGIGSYLSGQGQQATQPAGMSAGFNTLFGNPNSYYPSPNMMQPAPTTVGMPTMNVNKVA